MKKLFYFILFIFSFEFALSQPERIYSQLTTQRDIAELLNLYIEAINNGNHLMNITSNDFYRFNYDLIEKSKTKKEETYFSTYYSQKDLLEKEWFLWQPTYCCDLSSFAKREIVAFEQGERRYPMHLPFNAFIDSCNRENKSLLKSHQKKLDEKLSQLQQIVIRTINIADSINKYIKDKSYIQDQYINYQEALSFLYEAKKTSESYQFVIQELEKSVHEAFIDLLKKENSKNTPLKRFYQTVSINAENCKKLVFSISKEDSITAKNQLIKIKSYLDHSSSYEPSIKKTDSIMKWLRYIDVYHNKGECCLFPGFFSFIESNIRDTEILVSRYESFSKEKNNSISSYAYQKSYDQILYEVRNLVDNYNRGIRESDLPILKLTDLFNPFSIKELNQNEFDSNQQVFELKDANSIHLTLLIDISASMNEPEKLPLIKETVYWLSSILRKQDRISIITYADHSIIQLDNEVGDKKSKIKKSIEKLKSGGKTNIDEAFPLTFELASKNFVSNGNNKVVLITDGLFTLNQKQEDLIKLYNQKSIYLSVFYFGKKEKGEQIKMLKKISSLGGGNYYYITKKNIRSILFNEIK